MIQHVPGIYQAAQLWLRPVGQSSKDEGVADGEWDTPPPHLVSGVTQGLLKGEVTQELLSGHSVTQGLLSGYSVTQGLLGSYSGVTQRLLESCDLHLLAHLSGLQLLELPRLQHQWESRTHTPPGPKNVFEPTPHRSRCHFLGYRS